MRTLAIVLAALVLFGCAAPAAQEIEVTRIVEVTRVVKADCPPCPACPACPACPEAQRCPTQAVAAPAAGEAEAPKRTGSFLVGPEIAPGIWRSEGTGESCWIQVKDLSGKVVDISGDPPGGTIRIPAGDLIVVIDAILNPDCTWEYLKP